MIHTRRTRPCASSSARPCRSSNACLGRASVLRERGPRRAAAGPAARRHVGRLAMGFRKPHPSPSRGSAARARRGHRPAVGGRGRHRSPAHGTRDRSRESGPHGRSTHRTARSARSIDTSNLDRTTMTTSLRARSRGYRSLRLGVPKNSHRTARLSAGIRWNKHKLARNRSQ
jgi:hypothetical protein